jgi:cobalamin biosynthesis protein CobD/CbiB
MLVQAAVMTVTGGLLGFVAHLIRNKGMLKLIAGYDERKVRDKAGLQRFAGNGMFILCGILIAGGIFVAISSSTMSIATTVIVITWIIFVVVTFGIVIGAQRYSR